MNLYYELLLGFFDLKTAAARHVKRKTGSVIYCDLSPQSRVLPRGQPESSSSFCSSSRFELFQVPGRVKEVDRIQVLLGILFFFFDSVEEFQSGKQKQLHGLIKKHFGTFITKNLFTRVKKKKEF